MIFESILIESSEKVIVEEASSITFEKNDPKYQIEYNKIVNRIIFENYKKFCFNAWKFKNEVLAKEEFIVYEYQGKDNVRPSLEEIIVYLQGIKDEVESLQDDYAEEIFWPLTNAIIISVYITIGQQRIKNHHTNIGKYKSNSEKLSREISEMKGKKQTLIDLKNYNHGRSGSDDRKYTDQDLANDEDYDRKEEVEETPEYLRNKNNLVESERLIENLKTIKNDMEGMFHSYLKCLGNDIVKPKNLNKVD